MITYRKGPLGYAVNKDGKPVGSIKHDPHRGYLVSVLGFRPGDPATRGQHVKKTLREAKVKVEEVLS